MTSTTRRRRRCWRIVFRIARSRRFRRWTLWRGAAASIASPSRNRHEARMRQVTFAATQFASGTDNLARAESLVREAASKGAHVILIQELFASLYFCQDQKADHFALALPFEGHPLIARMAKLAKDLNVVLPVSFFERAGQAHFNSLAM